MLFNNNYNSYRNDKSIIMHINNIFKLYGYKIFYMPQKEVGVNFNVEEVYHNILDYGVWLTGVIEEYNLEQTDIFNKFGITVPDRITVTVRMSEMDEKVEEKEYEASQAGDTFYPFPQEGDLIVMPLQNINARYIDYSTLGELLKSGDDTVSYIYEVTHIDDKFVTFNGKSYYYKFDCKVYEKTVADFFEGDLDVINDKAETEPEDDVTNQDNYEKYKDSFNDLIEDDDEF